MGIFLPLLSSFLLFLPFFIFFLFQRCEASESRDRTQGMG